MNDGKDDARVEAWQAPLKEQAEGHHVLQVGVSPYRGNVLVEGLPREVVAAAIALYGIHNGFSCKVAEPVTTVKPDVPPTPALVPTPGGTRPYANPRTWVSTSRGHIAVEQGAGGAITPEEVQHALDMYFAFKDVEPELLAERLAVLSARFTALTVTELQDGCVRTAMYPGAGDCLLYPLLGLIDEVGEVMEVVVKGVRLSAYDDVIPLHAPVVAAMVQLGKVAGVLKKAYRNVNPEVGTTGVLDSAANDRIEAALDELTVVVAELRKDLDRWDSANDRVVLPRFVLTTAEREKFGKELGDAVWYWYVTLHEARFKAEAVARALLDKLRHRAAAGTIRSTGDDESTRAPGAG